MSSWNADTWIALIALLLSGLSLAGVIAFYVIRNTSKDEADDAIKPLEEKIDNHEQRITTIEAREGLGASKDDLAKLSREVAELSGEIRGVNRHIDNFAGEMKGVRLSVERVNDYLLREKLR
jgi:predicted  nucleic acid-binding Zn-ribbon protein